MSRTVQDVVDVFRRTMHIPDPTYIYLALAAALNIRRPGDDPIWLLIVGPPSSGKTEVLRAICEAMDEAVQVGSLTAAALLTVRWTDDGPEAGGILPDQVGDRGILVASDFGTLLSETPDTRKKACAVLREGYDGKALRGLGGRQYIWEGHVNFIGACTDGAIDDPSLDLGILGDRFTYHRLSEFTDDDEDLACDKSTEGAGRRKEVRAGYVLVIAEFFDGLSLPTKSPKPARPDHNRIKTLARLGARCRSSIPRNGYSREIDTVPMAERSMRLYDELRQFYVWLTIIGTPTECLWEGLVSVALDGMSPIRRRIIDYLLTVDEPKTTGTIAARLALPRTTTERELENLTAHQILDKTGFDPAMWAPSSRLLGAWWAVDGESPVQSSDTGTVQKVTESFPEATEEVQSL